MGDCHSLTSCATSPFFLKVTLVQWECLIVPRDPDAKLLCVKAAFSCRDSWCDVPWTKNNTALYKKIKIKKKIILIILMFKTYMKVPRYRLYLQEGSFYVIYILFKKKSEFKCPNSYRGF